MPINSKILLITNEKLSSDDKIKISKFFYVIDDVISPQHIAFGDFLQHKTHIIKCYNNMFNYICNNFDNFDIKIAYDFIKKENKYLLYINIYIIISNNNGIKYSYIYFFNKYI